MTLSTSHSCHTITLIPALSASSCEADELIPSFPCDILSFSRHASEQNRAALLYFSSYFSSFLTCTDEVFFPSYVASQFTTARFSLKPEHVISLRLLGASISPYYWYSILSFYCRLTSSPGTLQQQIRLLSLLRFCIVPALLIDSSTVLRLASIAIFPPTARFSHASSSIITTLS